MTNIEDLINNVANQDFANAGPTFAEIMNSKMGDALEQEKVAVASQSFNDNSGEEIDDISDEEIDDISDEEIDDAIAELDDEEAET